jgi:Kef-type K+ transport system membrane component KefB
MKNKRLIIILTVIFILLLIPFAAMQFTNEVNWTSSDFLIMGVLLTVTGLLCEIVMRKVNSIKSRIIICAVILFVCFLIWAELAVGIIGTPFAGS